MIMSVGEVRVRIKNSYSDGHESTHDITVPAPPLHITPERAEAELADWWEEVVFQYTGDKHGTDNDLGCCYTAEILDGPLKGAFKEWV